MRKSRGVAADNRYCKHGGHSVLAPALIRMNTSFKPLILLAACIAFGTGVHGITCVPEFNARWFKGGRAEQCSYRCKGPNSFVNIHGMEDNGTPCIIESNKFGVCYQGHCLELYLHPTPVPPVLEEATTGISSTAGTATRASVVSSPTTSVPEVPQHPEFTSTESEKETATRQSTSSSTATPGDQFLTATAPAVSQHSEFTPATRQWATAKKQSTSTRLPKEEATSEMPLTSTRARELQTTTQKTITADTKGTGVHGITCEPAFRATWFSSDRVLSCRYRCAWSIVNYGIEDNGTPCIIKLSRFGVCYQGDCVKNLPPTPARPAPDEGTTLLEEKVYKSAQPQLVEHLLQPRRGTIK
ncbi:uncharacterized protein LOC135388290 isoform X3 [Ornithodoros turicata]|uniref:uncharacterized protein LOC135388290 isoform X3 n=1 Tax=Ornithodoros turicata TaxID=34597 RepID=UPI003138E363